MFWPRQDHLQGGQREIIPDYSISLTDTQNTHPRSFALPQAYSPQQAPLECPQLISPSGYKSLSKNIDAELLDVTTIAPGFPSIPTSEVLRDNILDV